MRIAGEIILKSLGAWVAIWGFSRLLNAPKKLECYTAGVGMIGWAVYLIVEVFNDGILMKNFLAAVAVALVSQAMARHFKAPVILFVIPAFSRWCREPVCTASSTRSLWDRKTWLERIF